ncbi:MAG: hypothetical protein WCP01_05250 [Methylococcaceae bacterium]
MQNYPTNYVVHKCLLLLFLISVTNLAFAADAENMVRGVNKHDKWLSMLFSDPNMGWVFATRATTTDERTNATLILTYGTQDKCSPIYEINIKTDYVSAIKPTSKFGVFQVDNQPPKEIENVMSREEGDIFIDLQIKTNNLEKILIDEGSLMVNVKGLGIMDFSLSGAKEAIQRARSECKNRIFGDNQKSHPREKTKAKVIQKRTEPLANDPLNIRD